MSADIDQFIREQKSKIAAERNYLSKYADIDNTYNGEQDKSRKTAESKKEKSFLSKMQEGENMKNKYKQDLRNEYSIATGLNSPPVTNRYEKDTNSKNEEGLLHGLRYSNSASKRKENQRNQEYNDFKRANEAKFNNRFASKKNLSTKTENIEINPSQINNNPIISPRNEKNERNASPIEEPKKFYYPENIPSKPVNNNRVFESKLEELERKVEDLRNFRIQNPFIVYPTEIMHQPEFHQPHQQSIKYSEEPSKSLRYSTTNLGKNHMKYLDNAETRLKEIEEKYSTTKSQILKSFKAPPNRGLSTILDDDKLFDEDKFNEKLFAINNKDGKSGASPTGAINKSIIPLGLENEAEIKRHKQEQYRKQLQEQMKENQNSKSNRNQPSDEITFFDRFGQNNTGSKITNANSKNRESPNLAPTDPDSEYLFYASHNPLEQCSSGIGEVSSYSKGHSTAVNNNKTNKGYFDSIGHNETAPRLYGAAAQSSTNKDKYGDELKRQIEERKMRKEFDKKKEEEYERRKNEEIANYNPYGRGGGGAPLKDNKGEAVADLRRVLYDNPNASARAVSPYRPQMPEYKTTAREATIDPDLAKGFARGGHGIFGQALTQEDKDKAEKYKEELQIQIEMKKRQKDIEKENERIREEKELQRIEKQQKEMQIQLENERKLQQEKEVERLKQLEESHKATLDEKKRLKQERNKIDIETQEPISITKPKSPVYYQEYDDIQAQTKLEKEASQRPVIQQDDSRIMGQIVNLRNQLQNERIRIENALLQQKGEVEIYDPRIEAQNFPKANQDKASKQHEDKIHSARTPDYQTNVFQAVLDKKGPMTVRRNKPRPKSSVSKGEATEMDLDEYLKEQERILNRMSQNDFSKLELNMPKMNPNDFGMRAGSQMSHQLESDSDFIRYYQSNEFNPLKSSLSHRSESEFELKPSQMMGNGTPRNMSRRSSNTSLNIDELTRKNKERLRKLQKLQDENGSNQSSDDILNKIISSSDNDSDLYNFRK